MFEYISISKNTYINILSYFSIVLVKLGNNIDDENIRPKITINVNNMAKQQQINVTRGTTMN